MITTELANKVYDVFYDDCTDHMGISQAFGVVSHNRFSKNPLTKCALVLNYAKYKDGYLAQVGIARGTIDPMKAEFYWPNYKQPEAIVHNVAWLTKLTFVNGSIIEPGEKHHQLKPTARDRMVEYVLDRV